MDSNPPAPKPPTPISLEEAYKRIKVFGFLPSEELWNEWQRLRAQESDGTETPPVPEQK
jgi:hypothetical protein